jgi:hypothetical protein
MHTVRYLLTESSCSPSFDMFFRSYAIPGDEEREEEREK